MYIKSLIFVFFISSFFMSAQAELSRKEKVAIGALIALPAAVFGGLALKTLWDKNYSDSSVNKPGRTRKGMKLARSVNKPENREPAAEFLRDFKLNLDHESTIFDPDAGKCGFAALCAATGRVDRSKLKKGPGGLVNSDGAVSQSDIDNMILDVSSVGRSTRSKSLKEASERMRQNKERFLQELKNDPTYRYAGHPQEDPENGWVILDRYNAILWARDQKRNMVILTQSMRDGVAIYTNDSQHGFADDPKEKPIVIIEAPYRTREGRPNHWKAYIPPS